MRAAVAERYGPPEVVHITDLPRPEPTAEQVLVRVVAAAVTSGDARIRGARFPKGFGPFARAVFGITGPRRPVLGGTYSGVVEAVGHKVRDLSPGDAVCGMTGTRMGAHAEHLVVRAAKVARRPDDVGDDQAAGILFGGSTALHFLRDKATVRPGTTVLVNGASGAIGTSAVQLARRFGGEVTAVTSTRNVELVRRLGAAHVIDYTRHGPGTTGERFDLVLDTVGNLSIDSGRRLLAPGGRLLLAAAGLGDTVRARGDIAAGPAPERVADFTYLVGLVASGDLEVVVESLPFDDIVEAHRRVDSGHKVGNLVVHPGA